MKLNVIDQIWLKIFRKYTYKIYCIAFKDGFELGNDYNSVDIVHDLSTQEKMLQDIVR